MPDHDQEVMQKLEGGFLVPNLRMNKRYLLFQALILHAKSVRRQHQLSCPKDPDIKGPFGTLGKHGCQIRLKLKVEKVGSPWSERRSQDSLMISLQVFLSGDPKTWTRMDVQVTKGGSMLTKGAANTHVLAPLRLLAVESKGRPGKQGDFSFSDT